MWVLYRQITQFFHYLQSRALQLHPSSPSLYILAASHELSHLSHSAARVLLQRGIRLNPESIDLWREYLKMELGFVESLRRRWEVLGLDANAPDSSSEQPNDTADADDATVPDTDNSEKARKDVLQGALAKAVITSAVKGQRSRFERKSTPDISRYSQALIGPILRVAQRLTLVSLPGASPKKPS